MLNFSKIQKTSGVRSREVEGSRLLIGSYHSSLVFPNDDMWEKIQRALVLVGIAEQWYLTLGWPPHWWKAHNQRRMMYPAP